MDTWCNDTSVATSVTVRFNYMNWMDCGRNKQSGYDDKDFCEVSDDEN